MERFFHLQTFRPNQEEIIRAIVDGRDVLAVMATGGGKSLCYQLPAVMLDGLTIVISPLIALMKDQVDSLSNQGVKVATLNSSLSYDQQKRVEADVLDGVIRILYVSPERAIQQDFIRLLQKCKVSLFAVDEAHCISMWGHQFRPEYRKIKNLRQNFPNTPFAAFTATATKRVREDIIKELMLKDPAVFIGSFNRPNLHYSVHKEPRQEIRFQKIASYILAHPGKPGIIYCFSRADTENLADFLSGLHIAAAPYHAGMSPKERASIQDLFQKNEITVITATIAFGMGIDKPDVRYVIHAHLPKDIESYYQETGRAGRDGLPSDCILYYSAGDKAKMLRMMEKDGEENLSKKADRLLQLYQYCESKNCRRKTLLSYFDEEIEPCGNCDACEQAKKRKKQGIRDNLLPAELENEILFAAGEIEGMLTIPEFASFLMGMDRLKTKTLNLNHHRCYGVAKYYQRSAVINTLEELIEKGKLRTAGSTIKKVYTGK